jgi:thiaminase/transcriptional activator TenA
MSLAAALWRANADLAETAVNHRFVRGIAAGTVPREMFAAYIAQDDFFLEADARSYALALARSPDRPTLLGFADLLGGVRTEMSMHHTYAPDDDSGPAPSGPAPATVAYTDFLLSVAAHNGVGLTCAAMTPCMRLYAHLGSALRGSPSDVYAAWIASYAAPQFHALAKRLESLLDTHADDCPQVRDAYRRAMELELAFFDAAADMAL